MAANLTPPILSETPGADSQETSSNRVIADLFAPPQSAPTSSAVASQPTGAGKAGKPNSGTPTAHQLLSHYRARERDLQADLERVQRQLKTTHQQLIGLQQRLRQQNAALEQDQRRRQQRPRLQALLLRLRRENQQLRDQLQHCQEALDTTRRQAVNLRKQQHRQSRSRARLERRHLAQLGELHQQLGAARQQLHGTQRCEQTLRSHLAEARRDAEAAREQQRTLAERRQGERTRTAGLMRRLRAAGHDLQAHLNMAREQLESTRRDLSALQRQHYRQSLGQARLERRQLAQLLDLQQQLTSARQQLSSREAQAPSGALVPQRVNEMLIQEREMRQLLEQQAQRQRAQLEEELLSLQTLLNDLPGIYETKFRQRLKPLLEQRDWLLQENTQLRSQLPPGSAPAAQLPAATGRPRLRKNLKALFQLGSETIEPVAMVSEPPTPA